LGSAFAVAALIASVVPEAQAIIIRDDVPDSEYLVTAVDEFLLEVAFEAPGEPGITDLEGVGASGNSGPARAQTAAGARIGIGRRPGRCSSSCSPDADAAVDERSRGLGTAAG